MNLPAAKLGTTIDDLADNMQEICNGWERLLDKARADSARLQEINAEMLEALEAIESCLAPEDNDIAAQKVRAAIRKAKGEL